MALDDRDWYRDEVKKNPKRYGLPPNFTSQKNPKNYIYNPKQHRRSWNQHQKKPRQILIWVFWMMLLFGLFTVYKKFEKKQPPSPPIQLQNHKSKTQI